MTGFSDLARPPRPDTGLTHGTRYTYRVTATDPSGNVTRTATAAAAPEGSAQFDRLDGDRAEDEWAVRWARAYVEFAAGEKRSWLAERGVRVLPTVGWAERGDLRATGHGNSVPRFHITWGTGPGISEPFADLAREAAGRGLVTFHHRHQVDGLVVEAGAVTGVHGTLLAPDDAARGVASNRDAVGEFTLRAQAVIVTS